VRPGHARIGDERGAVREDAGVRCLDVRVCSDDRCHPAVEPPSKGDLLTSRLCVDVHEDERRLADRLVDEVVDDLEHGGCRIQEERPEDVDDREPGAVGCGNDCQAPSRSVLRRVCGTDDSVRSFDIGADLRSPERVVPERDCIRPCGQEAVREARRDADPVGGVLAVHDADVDLEVGAQRRQKRLHRAAARSTHHVGDEEDAQGVELRRLQGFCDRKSARAVSGLRYTRRLDA